LLRGSSWGLTYGLRLRDVARQAGLAGQSSDGQVVRPARLMTYIILILRFA
jgi:hypothetical protein